MSDQYWIFDTFCVIFSVDVSLLDAITDGKCIVRGDDMSLNYSSHKFN